MIIHAESIVILNIYLFFLRLFQNGWTADLPNNLNQCFIGVFFLFLFIQQVGDEIEVVENLAWVLFLEVDL